MQEIRRIAIRMARRQIEPANIIAWSSWRRAHQAAARSALISPAPVFAARDHEWHPLCLAVWHPVGCDAEGSSAVEHLL
jgi:hypothetical protein